MAKLIQIITQCKYWIEYILNITNLNREDDEEQQESPRMLTQRNFPFHICKIALPECNTGYLYFLISLRRNSPYIGGKNHVVVYSTTK